MRRSMRLIVVIVLQFNLVAMASEEPAPEPPFQALIEDLGSARFQVRETATNQLLAKGDEVVEPLRAVLDDADRERSRRARLILSKILNSRDMNAIVGKWDYVTVKLDGLPEEPGGELRIDRKVMAIRKSTGTEPYGPMPFTIDATKTPKHLDFEYKGSPIRCLYELDGDTLKLCYSKVTNGPRPSKIWSEPGSGTRLHLLERVLDP